MKFKMWFIVLLTVTLSCKEKELSEFEKQRKELLTGSGWYEYSNGSVSINSFEFPVYYSKVDTVLLYGVSDKNSPRLVFKHFEDDSVTFKIFYNDVLFSNHRLFKSFDSVTGLWESTALLDFSKTRLTSGDKFYAEVTYKNEKYKYHLTAVEKSLHTDMLGVKFGSSRDEVRKYEWQRFGYYRSVGFFNGFAGDSTELLFNAAPRFPFDNSYPSFPIRTQYLFKNDHLISVSENCSLIQYGYSKEEVIDNVSQISQALGNNEPIMFDELGRLKKQIKWVKNGVYLSIVENQELSSIGIKYSLDE